MVSDRSCSGSVGRFSSRLDDQEDVAHFEASLKVATHVAISVLVVFSFTWTVPQWPSGVKLKAELCHHCRSSTVSPVLTAI